MGFLDKFKKQKTQQLPQPPLPPEPPKPPAGDSYSHEELVPPPKIIDFDEEIPDLPELDIPEELGGNTPKVPKPQPKSEIVPPPQGHSDEVKVNEEEEPDSLPEAEGSLADISFNEEEKPLASIKKPVETESSPKPKQPVHEKKLTTYFHTGKMFVNDDTYGEMIKRLDEINDGINNSTHFKRIQEINSHKEEAIRIFKEEVKGIFDTLEQIDSIAFGKR